MQFIVLFCSFFIISCTQLAQPNTNHSIDNLRADIKVTGRTSKVNFVDIAFMGKTIPLTYSHGKITNSRGYNWWISKHFALKSDLPEHKVRLYLELLEMSYPHYVELFGMAPKDIDKKRIAVVYGSSRTRLKEAMFDDGFLRGIHKTAGGETMFYNRAGYNFPSHREHHQRYIVIHETMHAFHMALNGHSTWAPNWITEGLADSIASHVYYPDNKQLTVMVFDRAPMNYITTGIEQYKAANFPTIEQINDDPALKRGLNFFIIHFLMNDPVRELYFKRYLQQLMALNPHSEQTLPSANKLLKQVFPNWQALEQQFARFVKSINPTFNIKSGPWEQSGNAYWLRNDASNALHQLDISPNKGATHAVLDFPKPVLPDALSITEWNLAAKIEFEPSQLDRGEIGLGLFFNDSLASLTLLEGNRVKLDSQSLSLGEQVLALEPKIYNNLQEYLTLLISVKKEGNQLNVSLYTHSNMQAMHFNIPRDLSLSANKFSLLGKGMNHKLTPYISQHSFELPNIANNSPNPWYFDEPELFLKLLNTCEKYISVLKSCRTSLHSIAAKLTHRENHRETLEQLNTLARQWKISHDIDININHTAPVTYTNTKGFDGVKMQVNELNSQLIINITGPYSGKTHGTLTVDFYSFNDTSLSKALWSKKINITPYEDKLWQTNIAHFTSLNDGILIIKAIMDVDGEPIALSETVIK